MPKVSYGKRLDARGSVKSVAKYKSGRAKRVAAARKVRQKSRSEGAGD